MNRDRMGEFCWVFYLESAPVSKWNGGGGGASASGSFNTFRNNNDENSNTNSGGSFGSRNTGSNFGGKYGMNYFSLTTISLSARTEQGGFNGGGGGSGAFRSANEGSSRGKVFYR